MLSQQKQEIVALFQAALAPILAGSDLNPSDALSKVVLDLVEKLLKVTLSLIPTVAPTLTLVLIHTNS